MSVLVADLQGRIGLDDSAFNKALDRSFQKMGKARSEAARLAREYDAQFTVAGLAVAAGLGFAIKASSDLSESMAKSNVVFGQAATAVEDWANTSADSVLMSKQAALEATATYGNLLTAMGLNQDKAAEWSMTMTQLAADLASFNNTSVDEAVEALRSGLSGETEPLKRYGVALTDVRLKQEALDMGLIDSAANVLPPAIKMQAAYSLILKDTSTAQGDVERTGDGLANQQRRLQAEVGNAAAALGEALLPAVTAVVTAGGDLLTIFNDLPSGAQSTAAIVGVLGAAFLILAPRIVATYDALDRMGVSVTLSREKLLKQATLMASGGPWGVAILAAVGAVGLFVAAQRDAFGATEDWSRALTFQGDKLDENGRQLLANQLASEGLLDVVGELGLTEKQFLDLIQTGGPALDDLATKTLGFADANTKAGDASTVTAASILEAATATDVYTGSTDGSSEAAKTAMVRALELATMLGLVRDENGKAAAAAGGNATKTEQLGTKAEDASKKVDALRKSLEALDRGYVDLAEANIAYEAAIDDLSASIKENGRTLNRNTEDGRANESALLTLRDKILDVVVATQQRTNDEKKARQAMADGRAELIKQLKPFGIVGEAAEKYADKLGLIPSSIKTEAELKLAKARADLDAFIKKQYKVNVNVGVRAEQNEYRDRLNGTRALGGPTMPGTYLVGEHGPELRTFSRPGYITPADKTAQMLAGGGGGPSVVVVVDSDGQLIGRMRVEAKREVGAQSERAWQDAVYASPEV